MFTNNPFSTFPYQQNFAPHNYQQMPYAPSTTPIQPQAQIQNYEVPIQDIRFVTSEEAKAYIVMPNSKVLLIDRTGMAYLKTADNMGQSKTQYFRFEEVNQDGSPIVQQETIPQINFDDFVKKSDISKLGFITNEQYNGIIQRIEQLQKQIPGGKQNVSTK